MPEAVIVVTARSPIGRAGKGSLKEMRADDLTVQMVHAALSKIPGRDVVTPGGESAWDVHRQTPVAATTLRRICRTYPGSVGMEAALSEPAAAEQKALCFGFSVRRVSPRSGSVSSRIRRRCRRLVDRRTVPNGVRIPGFPGRSGSCACAPVWGDAISSMGGPMLGAGTSAERWGRCRMRLLSRPRRRGTGAP
jgi:hypothetical protein